MRTGAQLWRDVKTYLGYAVWVLRGHHQLGYLSDIYLLQSYSFRPLFGAGKCEQVTCQCRRFHNNGPGISTNTQIGPITLTQTYGTACGTPTITLPGPFGVSPGTLSVNGSGAVAVTLDFTPTGANCPANAQFTVAAQLLNNGDPSATMMLANQTE